MSIWEMFSLKDKVAVVTGGSGLYGRQIVIALAEAGAKVLTASRNLKANKEFADSLNSKGLDVIAAELDQSDEASIFALRDSILRDNKKIHILVNNAVARTMKQHFRDTVESFEKSMKINASGLFMMTRIFGDHMAETGGGSIINIGSYMGILGPDDTLYRGTDMDNRFSPDYFFHKGGMVNFTRLTAAVYGPQNVRCNVLNLGGFYNGQDETFVERYNDRTFLKRMANDTDIMGAVVYLASEASAYLTGAGISLDGGYSAK